MEPELLDAIPVEVMQQALRDSQYDVKLAAELAGYSSYNDLERALGLKEWNSNGKKGLTKFIPYEKAGKMIQNWNLWPIDYGL